MYVVNDRVGQVELVVRRPNGTKLRSLTGSTQRGLNVIDWDLSLGTPPADGGQQRRFRGPTAGTGVYVVEFLVDGSPRQTETLEILADPSRAGSEAANSSEWDSEEFIDPWYELEEVDQ
jgi:hypothetical protein